MQLDKELFDKVANEALNSPRLRKAFDLRDSLDENLQRMLNVLLPGSKTQIHRHISTSEVVVCIYGSVIERLYDENGNEDRCVFLKAGSDIVGYWIPIGQYHSLEAADETAVVLSVKAGTYSESSSEVFNI